MLRRNLICGLLASVALIGLPGMTLADHHSTTPADSKAPAAPVASSSSGACPPGMTTITVYERVPETYTATRTVYKTEYVDETYTAYRMESVPETRQVTRYVSKTITEVKDVVVNKVMCVPTTEYRTVTKRVPVCKQVTTISRKCVDQGHYECVSTETLLSRLRGHFNPCDHCPDYRTRKQWVPNYVTIETPVTKTVRSFECVTETVPVTVNKKVCVQEVKKVNVCRVVCEPVTETVTVNVQKCVPYTATRKVAKCVPVTETYTATRMVCKPVQKQVPVSNDPCADPCKDPCAQPCSGGRLRSLFRGGFGGLFRGCGCGSACEAAPACCN